jgi:cytochrome d ubiquinol oxidase subunit II
MLVDAVAATIWVGVLAYAVFGGADFGSGFWDLTAGGARRGAAMRAQIDHSIGPVWEANHVWLIFVVVYLWTAFPSGFAALATELYLPLALAAVGIVFRGGAFVFRKSAATVAQARFFGVLFASSSVVTPFFLGAATGAVASGRTSAAGDSDILTVWLGPTSWLGGVLAVGTCAWLAAVFLAADAHRNGDDALAERFRRRALGTGAVIGAISLAGVFVLRADAETLADHLQGEGASFVVASAAGGATAMLLVARQRFVTARVPAVIAVVAIVTGWGVGQYPWFLVDELRLDDAAAPDATLVALLVAFALAIVLVVPALAWLLHLSDRGSLGSGPAVGSSSEARLQELNR